MTTETTTISLRELRAHLDRDAGFWAARTSEWRHEDDTHLAAWAWIRGEVDDIAGADAVEVRHPDYAGGAWMRVVRGEG